MKTLSGSLLLLLLCLLHLPVLGQSPADKTTMTAVQLFETIIKNVGCAPIPNTVDVIKEGDPDTPVKGIVTSMFPTMEVLRQTVSKGCNIIIVHEPLYYNHRDETKQFQNDSVFLEKRRFIQDHQLVIWRFHDYNHSLQPDGILSGIVTKLKWNDYVVNSHLDQFVIPEISLKGLLEYLKQIFPKYTFYVVGKPEMKLSKVRLSPGPPEASPISG